MGGQAGCLVVSADGYTNLLGRAATGLQNSDAPFRQLCRIHADKILHNTGCIDDRRDHFGRGHPLGAVTDNASLVDPRPGAL